MATFNGTIGQDIVTPETISLGVVAVPAGSDLSGNDLILTFAGNDVVEGGTGNDTALLGLGNDVFEWDPGDGSDICRGGPGTDTLVFDGSDDPENMTVTTLSNGGFRFFRDVGNITINTKSVEHVVVDGLGGNDRISGQHQINPFVRMVVDSGDGNDTVIGGAGNDRIEGGRGNDVASGGLGNDRFAWDPGDGNDIFRGGLGIDTLAFDGSDDAEIMTITTLPNGGFRFFRDVGNITIDTRAVERVDVHASGGNDVINGSTQTRSGVSLLLHGEAGSDRLRGGAGADTFFIGSESHNGVAETDVIRGYNAGQGDVINLHGAGGYTASTVIGGSLYLTLAGADHDTLIVRGITNPADIHFVL